MKKAVIAPVEAPPKEPTEAFSEYKQLEQKLVEARRVAGPSTKLSTEEERLLEKMNWLKWQVTDNERAKLEATA